MSSAARGQSGQGAGRGGQPSSRANSGRDHRGHQRARARSDRSGHRSATAPNQRARTTDPARLVAFDVLRVVADSDAYANLALPPRLREAGLSGRDAAFATELTYGTLRLRGRYDAVLQHGLDRPLSTIDPMLLEVLRLGAHQLLAMRVPAHAAVSESVGLARERVGTGPGQLVNAVLRRVSERSWEQWSEVLRADSADPIDELAVLESHPAWMVRALRAALVTDGRSATELAGLLAADNRSPQVTLVARPGLVDRGDLLGGLDGSAAGQWSPYAVTLAGGDPARVPSVRRGRAGVQDEGSQLVAAALAAVPVTGKDDRWLDLCAGPGGKAALLAAVGAARGARLVANEVAEHRAALVRDSLRAVPPEAVEEVRVGDGRTVGEDEPEGYDRVIVDAPCTGLGALRRRPESRWRRSPADVAVLTGLQRELLTSALGAVRPGGVVGYVTCSPHVAETGLVVTDVLRKRDDVELLDTLAALEGVTGRPLPVGDAQRDAPGAQLWPHVHGTDAMYLALLRRR